jgi:hypothetical protein
MSAVATHIGPPIRPAPVVVGAIGCASLAAWGIFMPRAVLQGWLIGFVIVGGVPLGAVALMCVARLTGGSWAVAARPVLSRAAAATPLLCLAFLPVLFGAGSIFSWASHPDAAGNDVSSLYLNTGFFALRGGLALIGLSVVALLLLRGRGGRLLAALGLVFYAIAVDFVSVDWMLSLAPRFSSSAFGAEIAIQQILAALALLLVWPAARGVDDARDLAGLTLAAGLGVLYMETMSLIINWYGDQPDRATWYLDRVAGAWLWLALGALVFGAVGPIAALLFGRVRASPPALRIVGASLLLGVALHDIWLMAPNAALAAGPAAVLGIATIAALAIACSTWLETRLAPGRPGDGD